MKLRVEYMAQLRTVTGRSAEDVELPDRSSLAVLVAQVAERCGPPARQHLLNTSGQIQNGLLVVVNGEAHSGNASATRQLNDGDNIVLLPPIAGG